jgi:hypothetical protein
VPWSSVILPLYNSVRPLLRISRVCNWFWPRDRAATVVAAMASPHPSRSAASLGCGEDVWEPLDAPPTVTIETVGVPLRVTDQSRGSLIPRLGLDRWFVKPWPRIRIWGSWASYRFIDESGVICAVGCWSNGRDLVIPLRPGNFVKEPLPFSQINPPSSRE